MVQATQLSEQRRAQHALNSVQAVIERGDTLRNYRSYVDRLGPAILTNGLGQALASERAAAGDAKDGVVTGDTAAHKQLFENLSSWLTGGCGIYKVVQGQDVLNAIVKGSERDYLRAQVEAIAWLTWHKKFCRAYLKREDEAGS